jgi:MFS family permease
VSRVRVTLHRTFNALTVRNFRLYFTGQVISTSGTWMQGVAQAILVLDRLHGSGVAVGLVWAFQFLPLLFFASWGGLMADRFDKRRLLFVTQSTAGCLAVVLGILTITNSIQLWEVYLLALCLGCVNTVDNPARQTFVSEMVGDDLLPNAVSLNSVVMNGARVIGPAIGGVLIVTVGLGLCFFVNAASFAAVIVALALMRPAEFMHHPRAARAKGQVRAGLRYTWNTPNLRDPLLLMAIVGIFAYNFNVTLPLFAKLTFHGGAGIYALFSAAVGTGAVMGGLIVAHRGRSTPGLLAGVGMTFGLLLALVSVAPNIVTATVSLMVMGAVSIAFIATANATLQLGAEPMMRGRVMALYATAFLGSTPIGSPLVGAISDWSSPRVALALGGVITAIASAPLAVRALRQRKAPENSATAVTTVAEPPQPGLAAN